MFRYTFQVVIRPNGDGYDNQPEEQVRCDVTAPCELAARRAVLERAWSQHLLVSRLDRTEVRTIYPQA
jgi:hypothetical protein